MKRVSIIGNLYDDLCYKVTAPKSLKEKTTAKYSKLLKRIKDYVSDPEEFNEFVVLIDKYLEALNDEFEYERKEVFKIGYDTCNNLRVELGELKVVIDGDDITLDNEMFEKLYDERVEEVALITEAEKKRDAKQIKEIAYKKILPNLSDKEIKQVDLAIDKYMDSVYLNFGEYCKKYYYNGIKDSFGLTFVCSKKK